MQSRTTLKIMCAVFLAALVTIERSDAQNAAIPWSAFDMGYGSSASGNTLAKSVIGLSFVGTSQQADTKIESGFLGLGLFRGASGVTFNVQGGWNMVAVPNHVPDPRKTVLFPQAISNAFLFDNGYVAAESLILGRGYWLKFSDVQSIGIFGLPATVETVAVGQGWNLIGGISTPVVAANVGSIPPAIVVSNFFDFNTPLGYVASSTVEPGKAYWVKTDQAGSLIISNSTPVSSRVVFRPTDELPPPPPPADIMEDRPSLPSSFGLGRAFPNPFNPETRIHYMLPEESYVQLRIYNVIGEEVAVLVDQWQEAGVQTVTWNAGSLPSGVYFYSMMAGSFKETRKVLLMR